MCTVLDKYKKASKNNRLLSAYRPLPPKTLKSLQESYRFAKGQKPDMRYFFILFLLCLFSTLKAQTFVKAENDSTVMSEYNDGKIWAYRQIEDCVVGMTNYEAKDDYGKYYQIAIFIKNLGESSITFDPDKVTSLLTTKAGDTHDLQVYTYDEYMKKVKNAQALSMALLGFSAGMNAGMAGYQTTYTTTYGAGRMPYTQVHTTYNYAAASAANMAATAQMMTLSKLMADDRNMKSQGYLKITTVHPGEGIIGYMNIKRKKGQMMTVDIPVGDCVYSFEWDVTKRKK